MEFKDRLKAARRHGKLTQIELAQAVGISQTSITDLERGKSQSTSFIAELAKACGVDPLWLATGRGEMFGNASMANVSATIQPYKEAKEYPLISWVVAGKWEESCDNFQPGDADEWLESNANAGAHGYWLEVRGLSMVAPNDTVSFPPRMRILVQPEGFDLVSGKFYIAKLMDTGETTFKQYIRDAGVEYLQPLNPSFKTLEITDNVQIIGRVIDAKLPKALF
jgi:SOS-response transcriptional repressor LexA